MFSLFAKIILNASWLTCADTGSIKDRVRFKKGPQKVIYNFILLKKRREAFGGRFIGFLNKIDQQTKMLERRVIKDSFASIRLEIRDVVEEQVLFDLDVVSN